MASSERYKTSIITLTGHDEKLQHLRPVSFHLKSEPAGPVQYGLIAEEVAAVYPELVIRDDNGRIQGVRYEELAPILLSELQEQRKAIKAQNERISAQDKQLDQLMKEYRSLQGAIQQLSDEGARVAAR